MTSPAQGERFRQTRRAVLVLLAVVAVGGDLGCSRFRARRQATGTPVAPLGTEVVEGEVVGTTFPGTTVAPIPVEPAAIPSSAERPAPLPEPAAYPDPITQPDISLQPPVQVTPARALAGKVSVTRGVPDGARLVAASSVGLRAARATDTATTQVVADARAALDRMTTYQLNLHRQERVNDVLHPAEDLVMSIRRSPKAARLTWADGPHRGREVLYRADEPGGQMHVNMADSKIPLPRLSIAPDSPMVMKNSRHPITEAGLDPIVASLEQADRDGTLSDLGPQVVPPFDQPLTGVTRRAENGDVWRAYFDPANHLPALVECRAANGDLVESYLFRDIQPDPTELAAAAAFDPDARWGTPRGLFNRASARAGAASPPALR